MSIEGTGGLRLQWSHSWLGPAINVKGLNFDLHRWILLPHSQLGCSDREDSASCIQPECASVVFYNGVQFVTRQSVPGRHCCARVVLPPDERVLANSPQTAVGFRQQLAYFGDADPRKGFRAIPGVVDQVAVLATQPQSFFRISRNGETWVRKYDLLLNLKVL